MLRRSHRPKLWLCLLCFLTGSATRFSVEAADGPRVADQSVLLTSGSHELLISLQCPRFIFDTGVAGKVSPAKVQGRLSSGERIEVSYPTQALGTNGQLEVRLLLQWSADEGVLHKWAEFQLKDAASPVLLKEVVLEEMELQGEPPRLEGSGVQ